MQQVVINTRDYNIGLSLSREAIELFLTTKGIDVFTINKCQRFYTQHIDRDDPVLVSVVRQLGDKANGSSEFCNLKIVEIPDDVQWVIAADDDDGSECVAEVHRVWR